MNKTFIPVNEPLLNGNEKKYLIECIETGWISSDGPFVEKFEKEWALRTQRNFGIAVCNGSIALDTAIIALNLEPGDEIIMPTFTIISCAAAIVRAHCTPVLVDSDPFTWNMDINQVKAKITNKTKAIMAVHIYGLPVDMSPLLELAKQLGLYIIEDAAQMHGQTYKNSPCGSFGDISTFSFYPNKHITTGEGGMVLTNNACLAERCRLIRNLFFKPEKRYHHDELGHNFRMSNLQAAVGLAQLERLDEFVAKKRSMGQLYSQLLENVPGLQLPLATTFYADNIYWAYGIVLKDEAPITVAELINRLKNLGIGTRAFFWPMHEQPVFKTNGFFQGERYPIAEKIARRGLYIPSGLALTQEQIQVVVDEIKAIMSEVMP